ncbi:MAG TPA: hypothetical protein VE967_17915 [Gemmatimonadaceae bacterium]|nr:hypothetical protein [Gemmatimonadaceae bacterium]
MRRSGVALPMLYVCAACAGITHPAHDVVLVSTVAPRAEHRGTFTISHAPDSITAVVADVVRKAIVRSGMAEQPAGRAADVRVSVVRSASSQVASRMVSTPRFTQVAGPPIAEVVQVGTNRDGTPIMRTVLKPGPTVSQWVGDNVRCETVTVYEHFVQISAVGDGGTPLWTVGATATEDTPDDLPVARMLATVAAGYAAKSSAGPLALSVRLDGHIAKASHDTVKTFRTITGQKKAVRPDNTPRYLGRC